jgi:hypothetical protein
MNDQVQQVQQDLKRLQAMGKIEVLAAVAGISKARLKAIAAGAVPTAIEINMITMLR